MVKVQEIEVTEELLEEVPELKDFDETRLVLIRKISKMNDIPVVYLDSYWPYEIGIQITKHDLISRGMYEVLNELGIFLEKADQLITASIADEEIASAFKKFRRGAPILE